MKAKKRSKVSDAFTPRKRDDALLPAEAPVHVFGVSQVCITDSRGYATPRNSSPTELVLDASEGFIPLWAKEVNIRWGFNEYSMNYFQNPGAAKQEIRQLFSEALLAWGNAAPVRFSERNDACDFEIVVRNADSCDVGGCSLASAFFPDGGRHKLEIYPKMFTQSRKEQVDTLIHETGHIFGLRHFFANISETAWPSEIFGHHNPFSIMNYGYNSELTADDTDDLETLYQYVWGGDLSTINGTPIVLVTPFHELANRRHGSALGSGSAGSGLEPGGRLNCPPG